MEQRIKERYNDDILHEIIQRYDIKKDDIHLLDGFESFMYEFTHNSHQYILRVGHSIRRNVTLIQGEVDWINYLAAGGAGVAKAVPSQNGELVELADDGCGGHFLATAFVKAQGGPPWEQPGWNTAPIIERYGQLVGRIHALSKKYVLPDPSWKRPEWDDPIMLEDQWLPDSEAVAREKFRDILAYLRALPKDQETYGLIHFDVHPGNFFMDAAGNITLFDFDDCNYSWYMNDIAIVLFYNIMGGNNNSEFAKMFITSFLRGYQQENAIDPVWLKEIPHFLKLREVDLYALIYRSFDMDNLDEDPWVANYMNGRKKRIENDVPVIDFDFEELVVEITRSNKERDV